MLLPKIFNSNYQAAALATMSINGLKLLTIFDSVVFVNALLRLCCINEY